MTLSNVKMFKFKDMGMFIKDVYEQILEFKNNGKKEVFVEDFLQFFINNMVIDDEKYYSNPFEILKADECQKYLLEKGLKVEVFPDALWIAPISSKSFNIENCVHHFKRKNTFKGTRREFAQALSNKLSEIYKKNINDEKIEIFIPNFFDFITTNTNFCISGERLVCDTPFFHSLFSKKGLKIQLVDFDQDSVWITPKKFGKFTLNTFNAENCVCLK